MDILVFVSKSTGLTLLQKMENFDDTLLLVIGDKNRSEIVSYARKMKIDFIFVENFQPDHSKKFDWLVNLWGNKIFNNTELELASNSLNVHPSFLPYGKGSDPIICSIVNGWPIGASIHQITEKIDSGKVFVRQRLSPEPLATGGQIYKKVIELCIDLFARNWHMIRAGLILPSELGGSDLINKKVTTEMNRIKNLDNLKNCEREFLYWLLAYSFDESYTPQILFRGENYKIKFEISKINYQS